MDIKQWLSETAKRPIYDQDIANILGVTRKTWSKAISTRKPPPEVLNALERLGARAERILISGRELEEVA